MPVFTDEFIERVRNANDIVEIIGQEVQLKRSGQNYIGLCPFHSEKTPSFSVSPDKQMYYCFGCHAGGTVFNFVMETAKISFPEAVRTLAMRANIPLPEDASISPADRARQKERQLLLRVTHWATDFFHSQLRRSPIARDARAYLENRGLTPALIEAMKLGFALPDWSGLIKAAQRNQIPMPALAKLGLIIPRKQHGYYDRFRNRVIIPIADERGRVVAFGGRALDDSQPKYLNSPENPLFNKGRLLFGLHRANTAINRAGVAVLVEGYMDCLSAWQHGVEHVVASLGTALTLSQARLLKRYTNQVILCYDADSAGMRAALRGIDVSVQAGLQVKVASLPAGEDPDDCLRRRGLDFFIDEVLGKAKSAVDYQLDMLRREYPLNEPEGKARFVTAAVTVLSRLNNEVAKNAYAQQLARELQVPEQAVLAELAKQSRMGDKDGNSRNTRDMSPTIELDQDPVLQGCQIAEDKLLSLVINNLVEAEEVLLAWQELDVYAYPVDRQVVKLLLNELQKGKTLDIRRLIEQFEGEEVGQRLAQIAWAESFELDNPVVVAGDCLGKLKQLAIRQAISEAEKRLRNEKDAVQRKLLLQELQLLLEKQKGLRH